MDKFTTYVTSPKPADEITKILLQRIPSDTAPPISPPPTPPTGSANQPQLLGTYIYLHYYTALANVAAQSHLLLPNQIQTPDMEQLNQRMQNLIDRSYYDFIKLDSFLANQEKQSVDTNPLAPVYRHTIAVWKPLVMDSTNASLFRQSFMQHPSI